MRYKTRRFVLEVSIDTNEPMEGDMADQLLDVLTRHNDYPDWLFSIDDVEEM